MDTDHTCMILVDDDLNIVHGSFVSCVDPLTVCNPLMTVELSPLVSVSKTHVNPIYYNEFKSFQNTICQWGDVMTLIAHLIRITHSFSSSATFHDFGGCGSFTDCILLSHRYATSHTLDDAAAYGARSLAVGLGFDFSSINSHINQVQNGGIIAHT